MRKSGVLLIAALALLGGALAQQITWPVKGAVGQIWTVALQNYGTWTVALTRTNSAGIALGTALGADQRTGYFEYINDNAPMYFWLDLNADEGFGCQFTRSDIQGVTIRGKSVRFAGQKLEDLKSPCSATLETPTAQTLGAQNATTTSSNLSWPPAFAVNQVWSATFQSGTWVATMTQKDQEGDPVGVTTSGPDRRTAGVFMLNADRATMYTYLKDVEVLRCVAVRSGLSGNSLTGRAERFTPPDTRNPAQDAGPCSFTLQNAATQSSAAPAQPTPAQPNSAPALSFPPTISVGQTWNVQIGNSFNWVLTLSQTDSDGPLGLARGTDDRVGYFVYSAKDASLALFLDTKTERYGCLFDSSSLQGNSLRGNSFKSAGGAGFQPLAQSCTVTLQVQSISAQQLLGDWLEQRWIARPAQP